ncbi:MAG: cysteine--tRNA ligase [Patescibacteria group bacterium]|mgnify:FL=1
MLKFYNTLTKNIEEFKPRGQRVNMFVCGPTVYDYVHIGNARTFVAFDAIAKYLQYRGYEMLYLQNITDIDDRIIDRAQQLKTEPSAVATKYEEEFMTDMKALNVTAVDVYARATDHIEAIIKQIQVLMDKEFAYEIRDGIYFDLSKFRDYGKLSGRTTLQADDAVSRIDENPEKRNRGDFCLWKRSKDGEPRWSAPWFDGRPGWHIEDTAITETFFGPQYDVHGGGRDLIFPHHEAEIAQQEAASGKVPFVRYWMHVGFLEMKATKMSKSLGNFSTARNVLKEYPREAIRLYLLSAHYRSPLDFSDTALKQAEAGMMRIGEFLQRINFLESKGMLALEMDPGFSIQIEQMKSAIEEALDNDFDTPKAIGILFDLIRVGNQHLDAETLGVGGGKKMLDALALFDSVLGIVPHVSVELPPHVKKLVTERQHAKDEKNYPLADQLRQKIVNLGYQIDDTPYGPLVKKVR